MVIKRSDLYKILSSQLKGDYSIGLHGIDTTRYRGISQIGANEEEIAESILKNGLKMGNNRTINGTVAFFGRIDDADNIEKIYQKGLMEYNYGGREIVIIAIPTTFRSKSGKSMFLGDTNINGEYNENSSRIFSVL